MAWISVMYMIKSELERPTQAQMSKTGQYAKHIVITALYFFLIFVKDIIPYKTELFSLKQTYEWMSEWFN